MHRIFLAPIAVLGAQDSAVSNIRTCIRKKNKQRSVTHVRTGKCRNLWENTAGGLSCLGSEKCLVREKTMQIPRSLSLIAAGLRTGNSVADRETAWSNLQASEAK